MAADMLTIPDLKITAALVPGRVAADTLQIPSDPAKATLWTDGGQPCGTEGTVLIAGHVISYGTEGALWSLHQVQPGVQAFVTCSDGTVTSWYAVSAETLPKDDLPPAVFQRKGHRQLVVVTCGGPLLKTGHYRNNVIVRFEPMT
jgi:sortase (surface protein transpeptidase)